MEKTTTKLFKAITPGVIRLAFAKSITVETPYNYTNGSQILVTDVISMPYIDDDNQTCEELMIVDFKEGCFVLVPLESPALDPIPLSTALPIEIKSIEKNLLNHKTINYIQYRHSESWK